MTQALRFKVDATEKRRMRKASRRGNSWAFPLGGIIGVALSILAWFFFREVNVPLLQVAMPIAVLVVSIFCTSVICRQRLENPAFNLREEQIELNEQAISWAYSYMEMTEWRRAVWQAPYTAIQALDVDPEKRLLRITWQMEQRQVLQKDIYLYYRDQERMLRELSARCGVEIRQTPLSEG